MVMVRIPSVKGDTSEQLPLLDAKKLIAGYVRKGWLMVINGNAVPKTEYNTTFNRLADTDAVGLYPPVGGG
jgi:molybdopterin converting factor small subunit